MQVALIIIFTIVDQQFLININIIIISTIVNVKRINNPYVTIINQAIIGVVATIQDWIYEVSRSLKRKSCRNGTQSEGDIEREDSLQTKILRAIRINELAMTARAWLKHETWRIIIVSTNG